LVRISIKFSLNFGGGDFNLPGFLTKKLIFSLYAVNNEIVKYQKIVRTRESENSLRLKRRRR